MRNYVGEEYLHINENIRYCTPLLLFIRCRLSLSSLSVSSFFFLLKDIIKNNKFEGLLTLFIFQMIRSNQMLIMVQELLRWQASKT